MIVRYLLKFFSNVVFVVFESHREFLCISQSLVPLLLRPYLKKGISFLQFNVN